MRSRMITLALALLLLCGCGRPDVPSQGGHPVVDLAERRVMVPDHAERAACLAGTTYEKAVLMGQGAKVSMAATSNPLYWAARIDPRRRDPSVMAHVRAPNVEVLLAKKIDVVFFRNDPFQLQLLADVGIPAVVSLAFGGKQNRNVNSVTAFKGIVTDEVALYGQTLGPQPQKLAGEWQRYYAAKVAFVQKRLATIPAQQRPTVYIAMGPVVTRSYGQNENSPWYVQMAGGRVVTANSSKRGGIDVSIEQILLWNPQVIFVGHSYAADNINAYSTHLVTGDLRLRSVRALKSGHVYAFPAGVDYWDRDSEGVLLMEFIAKKLHPERFTDLDMVAEVKDYFRRFYRYALSDAEAKQILGEA